MALSDLSVCVAYFMVIGLRCVLLLSLSFVCCHEDDTLKINLSIPDATQITSRYAACGGTFSTQFVLKGEKHSFKLVVLVKICQI